MYYSLLKRKVGQIFMPLFNKLRSRRTHGKAKQPELYNNNTGVLDNINYDNALTVVCQI